MYMKKLISLILLSVSTLTLSQAHSENAAQTYVYVNDASDLDRLWERYFFHRDQAPIKQILEVINQDPGVMMFAFEYLNRIKIAETLSSLKGRMVEPELDDLRAAMVQYEKVMPDALNKITTVTAAMWSIDANLASYPQVCEDCQAILTSYPELDYRSKIRAILGK